jgi:hypothetical protein
MPDYVEESFHDEYAEQSARPLVEAHPEPTPTPAGTSVAMATATGAVAAASAARSLCGRRIARSR